MTDADRRRAAFAMVAADAFAKGAAQREREIVAGLRVSVGSFQPRFFSDGATEQPRRIGQCFSADDVERFTDYFSEDEDGYYSGHVHRYFGMDLKTFADRSHLRRVQITRKDGHRMWVWVNPNKKKPDERKPGAEKPKAERTSHPENVAKPTSDYHPTADSETAVAKALANPDSLTIDHVIDLADHLEKLQKSKVKAILKGVGEKVGGLKHELVDRLLEHLRGEAGLPTKKEKDAGVSDEFLNREQVDKTERELTKPVVPPIPRRKIPLGEPEVSDALGNKPVPAEKVAPTKPAIPPLPKRVVPKGEPAPSDDLGIKSPVEEQPDERGTGSGRDIKGSPEAGRRVENPSVESRTPGSDKGRDVADQPTRAGSPPRVPASRTEIHRRIDRFERIFRAKGLHEQADWMGKLRDHINAVGGESALKELGSERSAGGEGAAYPGWESMNDFTRAYLDRNGIEVTSNSTEEHVTDVAKIAPLKKFISNVASGYTVMGRPDASDFYPQLPVLKDKLAEAQHLPGLEKSEDMGKLMGGKLGDVVTHFSSEVMAKLNETYGEGKWIVKSYGDEAYAGYGIFFPQRVQQIQTDARNAIWESGERLARYGFSHLRDEKNRIVGIKHTGGKEYEFGTEEFDKTIQGDVRDACDSISKGKVTSTSAGTDVYTGPAIDSEQHTAFPTGSFMGQPAFPVVGISEAERAQGITFKKGQEGRTHVITRNGKAELVPNSTWLKLEHLPVVFETDDTRAMAKAALDAINALPESERQGQIYAPDILPTADGYRVVEANPSNMAGSSGYLENNPLIIDSYVSHLTGREPAHVRFIRNLLTTRQTGKDEQSQSHLDKLKKEKSREENRGSEERGFSAFSSHHDGEEWKTEGRWYRRTYGKTIRIARPGTKVTQDDRHVSEIVAPSKNRTVEVADKIKPIHEESKKVNKQYEEHAKSVEQLTAKHRSLSGSDRGKFMREQLKPALAKLNALAESKNDIGKKKRRAFMESMKPSTPQKIGGNFRAGIDMAEQGGDFQEIPDGDLQRAKAIFSPAKEFIEGVTNGMDGVRIALGASQSGRACAGIKGEQFFKGSVDYSVTIGVVPAESDKETAKTEEETAAHEFGHVIEDHKPGVRSLVHKFLAHRLGDEKPTKLADVMPGVGFEDYEQGYKDHFDGLFPDEISSYYTGMTYADGYYTEIVSMGMEQLYRDCGHFAETDPEYFHFMCHILRM